MPMPLPMAERRFEQCPIDDAVTLLWEPRVVAWMRCKVCHMHERDLLVDSGRGDD